MFRLHTKPSLDDFIQSCTPLVKLPTLESTFLNKVERLSQSLLRFAATSDPLETLVEFLRANDDFLGILLALTNLSQEKFLRILTAERFAEGDYGVEWSLSRVRTAIKKDRIFAEKIARLFIEGRSSQTLATHVADFYLAQVELPGDWHTLIQDPKFLQNIIRKKLVGEYTVAKGRAVEDLVRSRLDQLNSDCGVTFEHGQVALVQKEVDFALPDLANPFVLIMVSYLETTSSGQTQRANEQSHIFQQILGDNVRFGHRRILVNILDGAGWLARRSDLRKMHQGCDYALNINTLDQLLPVICHHLPEKYFTNGIRPEVAAQ